MTDVSTPAALRAMANAVRALSIDAVEQAKSGHPGMPMGMADAATLLFARYLRYDPAAPHWPNRDRFVLSAGHGSMLLYALLHLIGSPDLPMRELKRFRQLGSKTPGHPEVFHTLGVETTTGPLGQGLANAVGMAIAESQLAARFGGDLVDHRTWVIAGDGCLMEGVSQEAITLAGRLKLNKLIVIWDDNAISIDGAVSIADGTDQKARFAASGWTVLSCDGHDFGSIAAAYDAALTSDLPVLIACRTTIGYGAPTRAGTAKAHGEPLGAEEAAAAKAALGWAAPPFTVPEDVAALWAQAARRGAEARATWEAVAAKAGADRRDDFEAALRPGVPDAAEAALAAHASAMAEKRPALATRAASGAALEAVFAAAPNLVGGSADLTGSNNTLVKGATVYGPQTRDGRYIHYGVREHAMAAAMNGMALHGGVLPYGGTFLSFADYSRPAIRLAALMGVQVVHVMTHDSIGLGEDGPTHQPVEHLASLRAIPNLLVLRPCDAVETAECWALALARTDGPSVLALSRQATPAIRLDAAENRCALGAYEIMPADGPSRVALFATGTEVSVALEARALLAGEGIAARVISVPSFELFRAQPAPYAETILRPGEARVVVEAGVRQGWGDLVGPHAFVGMTGFGASAPAKDLYAHFQITPAAVAMAARAALGG